MQRVGKILGVALFILGCTGFYNVVDAHQSGCHRWHSCPTDSGSYTCGDLGYACQYSTYSNSSSGSYSSSYSGYTPSYSYISTPSCPLNSYASGTSCKCFSGYVSDGTNCVSASSYCLNQIGLMSNYNSLTNSCECMSGYEIGALGTCTYKSTYSPTTYNGGYSYNYNTSSLNTCPKNSTESVTDPTSCTCNVGYQTNAKRTQCVKIPKMTNDKQCQASFGRKSQWNGTYNDENNLPYCACKKGNEWNSDQTSCVKKG